jgi:hypothetical protein
VADSMFTAAPPHRLVPYILRLLSWYAARLPVAGGLPHPNRLPAAGVLCLLRRVL